MRNKTNYRRPTALATSVCVLFAALLLLGSCTQKGSCPVYSGIKKPDQRATFYQDRSR